MTPDTRGLSVWSSLETPAESSARHRCEDDCRCPPSAQRGGARIHVTPPDDDETADKYLLADEVLTAAGLGWYELSNWARDDAARCRHNLRYWQGQDWWGIGPGAHSMLARPDGTRERWWNVKHPAAYAGRVGAGESPRLDGELVDRRSGRLEDVMLGIRLREGIDPGLLHEPHAMVEAGYLRPVARAGCQAQR